MENKSIALDGPSGAGKSTLAKRAAEHFGLIYVDTGAMYRCVGLYVLRNGFDSKDIDNILKLLPEIKLEMSYDAGGIQRMFLNGEDVTEAIRLPEVSTYASDVSAFPQVRDFLLNMQREMAIKYNVVMDGRDIGTVVLPNAGLKVFITAKPETRAKRRFDELIQKIPNVKFEDVLAEMNIRDANDSNRAVAPLKAADDSITLDTSDLNFEESFEALCELIRKVHYDG